MLAAPEPLVPESTGAEVTVLAAELSSALWEGAVFVVTRELVAWASAAEVLSVR